MADRESGKTRTRRIETLTARREEAPSSTRANPEARRGKARGTRAARARPLETATRLQRGDERGGSDAVKRVGGISGLLYRWPSVSRPPPPEDSPRHGWRDH